MTDKSMAVLIANAIDQQMKPENIEPKISAAVEAMISDLVKNSLRTYSDNGKLIEEAIKESLKIGTLNLPSYGTTVCTILKAQIEAKVSPLISEQLTKDMDDLLNLAPKELYLSEIVKDMLERHCDYDDGCYEQDLVTCIVDRSETSTHIYLDEDDHHEKKYLCAISLFLDEDGSIISGSTKDRIALRARSLDTSVDFGRAYSLEQKVRAWWACGTKVIVDEYEVSTHRPYP
jgi:hypothetical protein